MLKEYPITFGTLTFLSLISVISFQKSLFRLPLLTTQVFPHSSDRKFHSRWTRRYLFFFSVIYNFHVLSLLPFWTHLFTTVGPPRVKNVPLTSLLTWRLSEWTIFPPKSSGIRLTEVIKILLILSETRFPLWWGSIRVLEPGDKRNLRLHKKWIKVQGPTPTTLRRTV